MAVQNGILKEETCMIRVTSTLIIHRPERVLYYLPEITDEIKQCIMEGVCPPALEPYRYTFGTYDEAGVFYLPPDLRKQVGTDYIIGIEYRKEDVRISYPQNLPFVTLPACNIIIQDIAHKHQLSENLLDEIITYAYKTPNVRTDTYRYVEGGLISAFSVKEKLRIMYEIDLVDAPENFEENDYERYTKEELYQKAYREPITNYYNWSRMWECLSSYYLAGVKDYAFVHFDIKDFKSGMKSLFPFLDDDDDDFNDFNDDDNDSDEFDDDDDNQFFN